MYAQRAPGVWGMSASLVSAPDARAGRASSHSLYPVSYTHLDVYKRQAQARGTGSAFFAVSIETGSGYGRVSNSTFFLHKETAGGGGGCHFAAHVQAGHAHGIVA